jgi:hypothetical protein
MVFYGRNEKTRGEVSGGDAAAETGVCGEGTFLESVAGASRHVAGQLQEIIQL